MCASAFFFSLMGVFVKTAGQTLGVLEIVAARGLVSLATGWWMMRAAGVAPMGKGDRGLLVLRGALGVVALVCYTIAVIRLPLAEATVFHFTSPLFTALLAAAFLGEIMGRREVSLAVLGFVGVLIVARPDFGFGGGSNLDGAAVAIGITGALFSAGAYTVVRRLGQSQHHLVIIHYYALATVAFAIPAAIPSFQMPHGQEWLLLVGVGLATQIGQIFLTRALQEDRAGPTVSIGYVQIGFATVWGFLLFDDLPDAWSVIGTTVIVASILLLGRVRSGLGSVATR